ncbi:MAG: PKD domain-containing protein [Candidatus Thermoplasmatota archaeon]|nr:PKD domain-containing protein [Candidatus Thermoplasmatota archaeon]
MNGKKFVAMILIILVMSPLVSTISSKKSYTNVAIMPYRADISITGVGVEIMEPEDGTVFHRRNVSLRCMAHACCGDKLTYWEWKWIWDNGSYSDSSTINYKTEFEFWINISLYPGWNKIDVTVKVASGTEGHDNVTLYYDGPVANTNGPYDGRVGKEINFYGSADGGYKPYKWRWDFGDGNESNEQNSSHTYTNTGVYKVILTVTDSMEYNDTSYTVAVIDKREDNFTHTVLAEYGTLSTCPHCPPASSQLYDIYTSGDYNFYYVSLVYDKNHRAGKRLQELNISGVPDVYFDGKYTHVLGKQSDNQPYRNAIATCGTRNVTDIDLDVNVEWKGNAALRINITVKNNGPEGYKGHLRAYIVEPVSRWNDQQGNPYHFGFLGFAFDRSLSLAKNGVKSLGGDTYEFTTTWRGSLHGFSDISEDNIMVITAVFNKETGYVNQIAAAAPAQNENDKQAVVTSVGGGDGYTNITVEEAWELLHCPCNGIQIPIDVRTIKEFVDERINVPSEREKPRWFPVQLMQREGLLLNLFMSLYKGQEIILYCRTGHRSYNAVQILIDNSFDGKIYNMVGGITAWKEAGLPTVKGFMGLLTWDFQDKVVVGIKG